jgi:hypothetical protein
VSGFDKLDDSQSGSSDKFQVLPVASEANFTIACGEVIGIVCSAAWKLHGVV